MRILREDYSDETCNYNVVIYIFHINLQQYNCNMCVSFKRRGVYMMAVCKQYRCKLYWVEKIKIQTQRKHYSKLYYDTVHGHRWPFRFALSHM